MQARFVSCLVLLLALQTAPGLAATIRVPADYATLQEAVAAAADGDTILVSPGTYTASIFLNDKVLSFRSDADGDPGTYDVAPETTILDGAGLQPVIFYTDSTLDGFTVQNGGGGQYGGGVFLSFCTTAVIRNCTVTANSGHGIRAELGSGTVSNCVVSGNGGGGIGCKQGSLTIENCLVSGNQQGIGVLWGSATIANTVVAGNYYSGGIQNYGGQVTITNCTVSGNETGNGGGINNFGDMTVTNTILWGDTATQGAEIYNETGSYLTVTHSDVQGGQASVYQGSGSTLTWGEGNLNLNPTFVSEGNYHLGPFSPCLDKGDNAAPGLPATDLEGNPRIVDGNNDGTAVVDMGAYELQPAAAWGAAATFATAAGLAGSVGLSSWVNSFALLALPLATLLCLRRRRGA